MVMLAGDAGVLRAGRLNAQTCGAKHPGIVLLRDDTDPDPGSDTSFGDVLAHLGCISTAVREMRH